jgi:hypothetical protein
LTEHHLWASHDFLEKSNSNLLSILYLIFSWSWLKNNWNMIYTLELNQAIFNPF